MNMSEMCRSNCQVCRSNSDLREDGDAGAGDALAGRRGFLGVARVRLAAGHHEALLFEETEIEGVKDTLAKRCEARHHDGRRPP